MSETTITIWGKTKLTVRRGRILRCLLFLCLSSFLNNLKILVAQTQYERTLSVIINGIYPLEKLWVFQITTIPPLLWSQSILTRISDNNLEINCGSPGILPNGWLEGSRTTLHAVVTFRCEEGMTFSGPSYRTICQADGRWSHPVPRCYGEYRVTVYPGVMVSTESQCTQVLWWVQSHSVTLIWTNFPKQMVVIYFYICQNVRGFVWNVAILNERLWVHIGVHFIRTNSF